MTTGIPVQDSDPLWIQVVVNNSSEYDEEEGNVYGPAHIVSLRHYRMSGNEARHTNLIFSNEPSDGHGHVKGYKERVTIAEILAVLGNTAGRFDSVRFVNLHNVWDWRHQTLLSFLLVRTRELEFFDCRTEDHIIALHMGTVHGACNLESLSIYEFYEVSRERSGMLFHAISSLPQLKRLQVDGVFPSEFGNQLCYDLAQRIRNLRNLETFILQHTAFDTLGNDASFSDLLCVAATQAKGSTIVAMSSRDPDLGIRRTLGIVRRFLNFSSLAEICCHPESRRLTSLHLRYVHILPNTTHDERECKTVCLLDLQNAFHICRTSPYRARGDQIILDDTQFHTLRMFPHLRILRMNDCYVRKLQPIVWYLSKSDCQLSELLLESNEIGGDEFKLLVCNFPQYKSLRYLSLRRNPFEHNLSGPDRWLYFQLLPRSRLLNFPFDERIPMDKWDNNYQKLTPVLCYHQASYLLDLLKKGKRVPTALWPRMLQHLGRSRIPQLPPQNDKHEPFGGFGDMFNSGAFLASNSESIAVDRAHVLFSILRQDMMNSQVIGNGSQAVTLAHGEHAELNQSTADEIQDVMDDIEQHSISREQEAREQQRLDEAIAHNDFNLAT